MAAISQFVVTFLLNAMWEITLICGVAQIGSWTMRAAPARFRYRVWVTAILLASLLPLGSIVVQIRSSSLLSSPIAASEQRNFWFSSHGTVSASSLSFAPFWMYPLVWCYFAFLAYRLIQFVWAWRRTKQLRDCAYLSEFSPAVLSIIRHCRSAFEIEKKTVSIRCSSLISGPVTVGDWTPEILLPADVLRTASQDDWLSILSHEMAHVCRRDFVKNLVCEILSLPVSFHPLTALMKSRLAAAREIACDELATTRCIEPEKYVRSLLTMAGKMLHPLPNGSLDYSVGILDGNTMEERVMTLLRRNSLSVFWSWVSLLLVLGTLAAASFSASAYAVRVEEEQAARLSQGDRLAGQDSKIPRVGPGITAPHPISTPDPEYPKAARSAKREGTVQLWCVVGTDGIVHDVRILKSQGRDLDESAMTALRKWKFEPATKAGEPIAVQINVETTFRLYN
jgi:TonB family protein